MMHVELLKLALVVALSSNAILLAIILVKSLGDGLGLISYECCQQSIVVTRNSRISDINNGLLGHQNDLPIPHLGKTSASPEKDRDADGYNRKMLEKGTNQHFSDSPTRLTAMSSEFKTMSLLDHSLVSMGEELVDQPNVNTGESITQNLKDSKLQVSIPDFISSEGAKRFSEFYSQLRMIQRNRLLEIERTIRSNSRGIETRDNVLNVDSTGKGNLHPFLSSQSHFHKKLLHLNLEPALIRTKRSRRSDVIVESEKFPKRKTESQRGRFTRRPFSRKSGGTFAERRRAAGNGTRSGLMPRDRKGSSRTFGKAKRRFGKGRKFQSKKMRGRNDMRRVFSRFSDDQVSQMSEMVTNVLLPSLMEFENLVGSHITGIRSYMVAQELRIEQLEKATMELTHAQKQHTHDNVQNDEEDNLTNDGQEKIENGVEETLMGSHNITIRVQVFGKEEGSGDGDDLEFQPVFDSAASSADDKTATTTTTTTTTPSPSTTTTATTTTPTTTTTTPPPTTTSTTTTTTSTSTSTTTTTLKPTTKPPQNDANYEELYQFYSTLNQKVDDINNYNMMSATELHRTQSIAIRMDDKVTELERKFKNIRTRDNRQLYRLTELEIDNSRMDASVRKSMKDLEKIEERFDVFRDHMDNFKNNVHKVNSNFAKYEQISDELRTADAYKAHDIQDIRESVMNVETRVNGIYRVLDEGVLSIRYEMDAMVERVCTVNKLNC